MVSNESSASEVLDADANISYLEEGESEQANETNKHSSNVIPDSSLDIEDLGSASSMR